VTQLNIEMASKRLELLHELVPKASIMALLINPNDQQAKGETRELQAAARSLGVELHVFNASTERDFDAVFANLAQLAAGLVIGSSAFFLAWQEQLAALAVRHAVPTVFENRQAASSPAA
jgi:putative tryptophan/tyrosine transport system substrate-binding protein